MEKLPGNSEWETRLQRLAEVVHYSLQQANTSIPIGIDLTSITLLERVGYTAGRSTLRRIHCLSIKMIKKEEKTSKTKNTAFDKNGFIRAVDNMNLRGSEQTSLRALQRKE